MFVNEVEYELFSVNKPQRILTEQIEELWFIHSLSTEHKNCINWNKVFYFRKGSYFPFGEPVTLVAKQDFCHLPAGRALSVLLVPELG